MDRFKLDVRNRCLDDRRDVFAIEKLDEVV
jgi:hypothetical protein